MCLGTVCLKRPISVHVEDMDLRSIINNSEAGDNSARQQAVPTTASVHSVQPRQSPQAYSQPPASISKHPSQDYSQPPYGSPTAYQRPYPGRPSAPTPIQAPPQNDLRSPVSTPYSSHSPYRQTPSSTANPGQYPFPPSATPQSPVSLMVPFFPSPQPF